MEYKDTFSFKDFELYKELEELSMKAKKLPLGSEERLELEMEMVEIEEWLPGGSGDYVCW